MAKQGHVHFTASLLIVILLAQNFDLGEGKRFSTGGSRKTSSSSSSSSRRQPSTNSGHVTKPSYNTNYQSHGNSHADQAKLSYPNYNAQPNRPASNVGGTNNAAAAPAIGWNVPKAGQAAGPPPAYSASNPMGGAKTNIHEQAPAYRPNNAAPPSYGAATNVHTPITATRNQGVQSSYPQQQYHAPAGATYHPAGQVPAGATYYPAGHAPPGASYYPAGHMPAGASYYPGGHAPGGYNGVPQGATYYSSASALPAGAVFHSQPPQSSGPGFGTGLIAGALGGAVLGHALTPSRTQYVQQAPVNGGGGGGGSDESKVIIINNGPPGSVTTSENGATIINTQGGQQQPGVAAPAAAGNAAPPMADSSNNMPAVPLAPMGDNNNNAAAAQPGVMPPPVVPGSATDQPQEQAPPQAGGIICVPVSVNETDPTDSTKMIQVEKIACYPAPPPAPEGSQPPAGADGSVPLAPMISQPGQTSQQMQHNQAATQSTLMAESASIQKSGSAGISANVFVAIVASALGGILSRYGMF